MKRIDETMLLLAMGDVGEDLVERAEARQRPERRHISLHFAALAACLCLIVGVTAPRVIGGFSAGSSVDRADGESAPGAVSESNMAPESGAEAEKDTAAALPSGAMRALGIMSAEDIVSVSTATLSDAETYKTYKVIGQEDMTAVREEEKRILPETGAELYALLTGAEVIPAQEDGRVLHPTEEVSFTLSSGMVLKGQYDAGQNLLRVGQWHFYFSEDP
ncbi:MAG: hypothetical protein MR004_05200 [Clostridiales bacterium]|nr:hypothetical protein [Clostridiales bacterium]MDY4036484.1 hypothetical protein [Candidatus Pseudoscilispira sp.]